MWDFDSIYGKAQIYFKRAQDHSNMKGDEFLIWSLLGFEFLLRAPLARIHPSLLADPNGDSILYAAGVLVAPDVSPKSIPAHTVISRLGRIVPDFSDDRSKEASTLINLRNVELHTGSAIVSNTGHEFWMPKLVRVSDVIVKHLGVPLEDLLGSDVVLEGQLLVDAEDKRLAHAVALAIESAKDFFGKLSTSEISSRRALLSAATASSEKLIECPACKSEVGVSFHAIRITSERIEDGAVVQDVVYVITGLNCLVCSLHLSNTAEIGAAGLPQQFTLTVGESVEDRFLQYYGDDEYGND